MAVSIQVTFDCHHPEALARFWAEALGYVEEPPPEGFADWPSFLRTSGFPEDEWGRYSALVDPDGGGPRVLFQKVPEAKVAKNRMHLDLSVSGGRGTPAEARKQRIAAAVGRLEARGATALGAHEELGVYWMVMQDPEGNEFCLH
jgi:hypothetical protein